MKKLSKKIMMIEEFKPPSMIQECKPPNMIKEYEINPDSMLIIPIRYGSKLYSRIVELEREMIVPFRPSVVIDKSCKYFGSSLSGRLNGAKHLTGYTQKVPITIDPTNNVIFLPTHSSTNEQCHWLALRHIVSLKSETSSSTLVTFSNDKSYIIPASKWSLVNQIGRSAHFCFMLDRQLNNHF